MKKKNTKFCFCFPFILFQCENYFFRCLFKIVYNLKLKETYLQIENPDEIY